MALLVLSAVTCGPVLDLSADGADFRRWEAGGFWGDFGSAELSGEMS
jgi:hypothetical protein